MKHLPFVVLLLTFVLVSCKKEEPAPKPVANFTIDKTSAKVGETITFTNSSEHAISYEWSFGDGNTSTMVTPTHSYSVSGTFTIALTAMGEGGTNSTSQTITIIDPEPIAGFTISKSEAETGETITFTNTSENATSYQWEFGDGNTSTELNPTHSYTEAGYFTVKLNIVGPGGNDSSTESVFIYNIIPGERISNFILGDDLQVHFGKIDESTFLHSVIYLNGKYYHLIKFTDTGLGFFVINSSVNLYTNDIPTEIWAYAPYNVYTEKGITIGTTLNEVEAAYGTPESIGSTGSYYYGTLGIGFWADDSETQVKDISIYNPSTKKSNTLQWTNLKSSLKRDNQLKFMDKSSLLNVRQ